MRALDRPSAGSGGGRPRDRLAGRHGRHRLQASPRDRGPRASDTREGFDSHSGGGRGRHGRDPGHRLGTSARSPPRDTASTTGGPARLRCRWRRPDRLGRGRHWRRRRLFRRARLRLAHWSRGQERQRIDVAVRLGGHANTEVHVRLTLLGLATRADRGHDVPFLDSSAGHHADRADVDERDRVAVRSANRHAEPFVRHLAGERDDAGGGRAEAGAGRAPDVDPAMLAAGVGVVVGRERSQDRSFDGPRPTSRRRAENEREQHPDRQRPDFVA
jgi:hypothetical protein